MVTIAQPYLDSLYNDLPCLQDGTSLFSPESPVDFIYNCIAWAMGCDIMWVGSNNIPWMWWPAGVPCTQDKQNLVDAFKSLGFVECDDDSYEDGYRKVALYAVGDQWTHAARVLDDTKYHSKFGVNCDGYHSSDPKLFDGTIYGCVFQYMKRLIADENITASVIPNQIPPTINRDVWSKYLMRLKIIMARANP